MTRALIALYLLLAPVPVQQPGGNSARIRGEVLSQETGMPLAGVRVLLLEVAPPQTERVVVTDPTGAFVFDGLGAGLYMLDIDRDAYRLESYERLPVQEGLPFGALSGPIQKTVGGTRAVNLEDGERFDTRVRMTGSARVAGRVTDSEGRPVANAQVGLFVPAYYDEITGVLNGVEEVIDPVRTDANGDYRFESVSAGEYYLRAEAGAGTTTRLDAFANERRVEVTDAMSRTWYPGFAGMDAASRLVVNAGSEIRADVRLVAPVPRTVSGRIEILAAPGQTAATDIYLVSRAGDRTEIFDLFDDDAAPDRFELRNVRPGFYELYVVIQPTSGNGRKWRPSIGQATIDVRDQDLSDIVVTVRPNVGLAGEIRLDPTAAGRVDRIERLLPMLTLDPGLPRAMSRNPTIQMLRPVEPDGTFRIPDVPAVSYRVSVMQDTLPPGVYLSAARLNGRDVLGEPFVVDAAAPGPLVLELRGDGGRLTGRVDRSGQGVANARVVLVPSGLLGEEPTAYRIATTDSGGRFSIEGIRPGAYTAFAFGEIPYGAWLDAAFMAPWLSRGETFALASGQEVERDLVLIPR